MESRLRLLIVDDAPLDADLSARQMKLAGYDCTWERVDTEPEFRARLREFQPDLIFSDFSMPQFDGLSALELAAAEAPGVPFIFVSGTLGEQRAIQALKLGATDFVPKDDLSRLGPAVARALAESTLPGSGNNPAERIRRLSGALQMLSGLRTATRELMTRSRLLDEACRIIHASQQYGYAFIALANPHTRTAHTVAWRGAGAARDEDTRFHISSGAERDLSSTSFVLRTGEPNICLDIAQYRGPLSPQERCGAEVSGSFIALPLLVDGKAIGALTIGGHRNATLSEQELLLLEEFTGELSFALRSVPDETAVTTSDPLDPLTRLNRRDAFCEHLGTVLETGADAPGIRAVVVFDIERLHDINITYGRHVGDRLLQCVAERLKRRFKGSEDLGYFGGGTFAAVFSIEDTAPAESAHTETQRIPNVQTAVPNHDPTTAVFGHPFSISDHAVPVTVKCGLARLPVNGTDPETLLQFAESALQKLRDRHLSGRHTGRPLATDAMSRAELERHVRYALEHEHFSLHYQPQVEQRSGQIVGVEALLRWVDPERGPVAPGSFLPALETSGLIVPIGEWVLARAVRDWRRWEGSDLEALRLAVNVTPAELGRKDFATRFLDATSLHGGARCQLDIEITESALLADAVAVSETLALLRAAGVHIAIDDFGMGFSSLNRLCELPIDTLKIDRAFVSRLTPNPQTHAVVTTIISLARAYRLQTIAEGVETIQQLQILKVLGCEQSQGFLHSPPVRSEDLQKMMRSRMTRAADSG
jgi:diguanylate cyclase (GGDEF)-like protein